MKKTIKKIFNYVGQCLYIVIAFAFFSVIYYMKCWNVEFATALYQMSAPLKGTNPQYITQYIRVAGVPFVSFLFLWYLGWKIVLYLVREFKIVIKIQVLSKKYIWVLKYKIFSLTKRILAIGLSVLAVVYIMIYGNYIGMIEFAKSYTNSTTLFEECYVSPQNTTILFPAKKKNLLLIYLESMETTYMSMDVGGGKKVNYIPELTSLAEEYINFSNSDQLGGAINGKLSEWTIAALLGSSCGVPFKMPIGENDADDYSEFLPGLIGLGDILYDNGYNNYFLCGSEASFAGRDMFFKQHGNYTIYDYDYAVKEGKEDVNKKTYWGYDDRKLFQYAKEYLSEIGNDSVPFNFTMLTVDTHHPDGYLCELCKNQYDEQYANVLSCSSKQVAEFVNWVQEQPWYEDTVIVLIGDHLSMNTNFWSDIGDYQRCIYNCFINTDKEINNIDITHNRVFCSFDFFPTILSAMSVEIEGNCLGLGVDLFSGEQTLYEKFGIENLNQQLMGYSKYYMEEFVQNYTIDRRKKT